MLTCEASDMCNRVFMIWQWEIAVPFMVVIRCFGGVTYFFFFNWGIILAVAVSNEAKTILSLYLGFYELLDELPISVEEPGPIRTL